MQDEEQKAENVIEENAVEMELTKIEQLCEKQRETQEWCQQRQLLPRCKKPSESDCGVPKAPKFQVSTMTFSLGTAFLETRTYKLTVHYIVIMESFINSCTTCILVVMHAAKIVE